MLLSSKRLIAHVYPLLRRIYCACILLADYQKSTYQQTKLLLSIPVDNSRDGSQFFLNSNRLFLKPQETQQEFG